MQTRHSAGDLACDLLLKRRKGRWVEPGERPARLGRKNTRRNLLKTEEINMLQIDAKVLFLGQADQWRKWETLWVM